MSKEEKSKCQSMSRRHYIFENKKNIAIEHDWKFLDLWKDADPGIPEVEAARERMAGLSDENL